MLQSTALLLGHIGALNAGDDAICLSFVDFLSGNPGKIKKIFVQSYGRYMDQQLLKFSGKLSISPIRTLLQVMIAFLKSNVVILNGGDYLDDFGSLRKRARAFSLVLILFLTTRLFQKKVMVVNGGLRAKSVLGLTFLRLILTLTTCISVRDFDSFKIASSMSSNNLWQGLDTVLGTKFQKSVPESDLDDLKSQSTRILGISITPFFRNFYSTPVLDERIAKHIGQSLNRILTQNSGLHIWFFAFNSSLNSGDLRSIHSALLNLNTSFINRVKIVEYNGKLEHLFQYLNKVDFMVACKYHSIIFSYMLNKPMVIILYHPKCLSILKMIGLPNSSKIPIRGLFDGSFERILKELINNPTIFVPHLSLDYARRMALDGIRRCVECVARRF